MRFLHARIYRDRLRELTAARAKAGQDDSLPGPELLLCSRCEAPYLFDVEPDAEPVTWDELEWLAAVKPDEECPDHPAQFELE